MLNIGTRFGTLSPLHVIHQPTYKRDGQSSGSTDGRAPTLALEKTWNDVAHKMGDVVGRSRKSTRSTANLPLSPWSREACCFFLCTVFSFGPSTCAFRALAIPLSCASGVRLSSVALGCPHLNSMPSAHVPRQAWRCTLYYMYNPSIWRERREHPFVVNFRSTNLSPPSPPRTVVLARSLRNEPPVNPASYNL